MIQRIRRSFFTKVLTVFLLLNLVGEIVFPTVAYGLTSGPISIDQASFEPASTSEMVNLSSGDFTYNIPLMDVDGYPINLAYHGDVNMDQEASMVGLGWTINVGAMNRMKRGLPDDFKGDEIVTEMNVRPRTNTGGSLAVNVELVGWEGDFSEATEATGGVDPAGGDWELTPTVGGSIGVNFSNYIGYGVDLGATGGLDFDYVGKKGSNYKLGIGLGLESSSQNGISISPHANAYASVLKSRLKLKLGIGFTTNSVQGLQNINTTSGIGVGQGKTNIGVGSNGVIAVSSVCYTPTISFESNVKMYNFDFDLGGEIGVTYTNGKGTFFRSITCQKETVQTAKGYGYFYEGLQTSNENYLLDFNREGTVIPNKHIAYLPITNHTYDVFCATAQGVGFSSRPFRSDILVVSDAKKQSDISGLGISGELGFGNLLEAGLNIHTSSGYVKTGVWKDDNSIDEKLVPNHNPNLLYEPFYFKKFENRSSSTSNYMTALLSEKAVRQIVLKAGADHLGTNQFVTNIELSGGTMPEILDLDAPGVSVYKQTRDLRNTNIQYLTASEATNLSLDKIYSYDISTPGGYDYTGKDYPKGPAISRYSNLSSDAKAHHLSEMTVLEGDGSRYIYGIPVINQTTKEVIFNVSNHYPTGLGIGDLTPDCETGLIGYQQNYTGVAGDNSTNNRRGDNNLYISNSIPAYATSYLLTAYLSSNYEDLTGDGPTPDDLGNYTKFNYAKSQFPSKWRFPFEEDKAAYNEGLKADEYDDMGSYVYGEKDQWYMHSIESKNFVAEFHYSDRHDGYSVFDENGGIGTNESKKLESISLYTREGKANGEPSIKTVHFEYDYSLCGSVPNNDGLDEYVDGVNINENDGKLTLKGIYFTYGNSNRGKLHKYKFDYDAGNPLSNPDYSVGKTNRWGTYTSLNQNGSCDSDGAMNNLEFPYANQEQTSADLDARVWSLSSINLPSGSKIEVDYESDDYSYVQDKEASRMFKLKGMSNDGLDPQQFLYDENGDRNYLHIDLGSELAGMTHAEASQEFKSEYVGNITQIYFKFLVSVSREELHGLNGLEQFEYISGYAEIDPNNIYTVDLEGSDGIDETGLIRLKSVHIKDKDKEPSGSHGINPITKASWQFTRKYLPTVINPIVGDIYTGNDIIPYDYNCDVPDVVPTDSDDSDPTPSDATNDEGTALMDMYNLGLSQMQNLLSFGGINFMMKAQGYSSKFVPEKSWVRLYQGTKNKKLGGGQRVKKIEVTDNWNQVKSAEQSSTYGTQYKYTKIENGQQISSGVAYYEPITSGGDENTMRNPVDYNIDVKFRVNDEEFQERPLGESIFASTQIAYSKVEVSNINYTGVSQNATGKTVYEFYTARDFPLLVEETDRASSTKVESKSNGWTSLFTGLSFNYLTMSQGYSVQLNDMHGKFKGKKVLSQTASIDESVIYSLEHKYYVDPNNSKKLKNELNVVNEQGVISTRNIGKDMDMVVDLNESSSFQQSLDQDYGLEVVGAPAPPLLLFFPSAWFSSSTQDNRFRSSVTTKVVYSNGILEQILLEDKGRKKSSKNILFDEKTGVPLVTEIHHEIGPDALPIYQYDYPAYWIYEGMGLASENWRATFLDIADTDGKIILANYQDFLNPGDEIALYNNAGTFLEKCWVIEDEAATTQDYYIVNRFGDIPGYFSSGTAHVFKVVRSGKRNLLGSTVASVSSLDHAFFEYTVENEVQINSSPYAQGYTHTRVINASAAEFTEHAFAYAGAVKGPLGPACGLVQGTIANPYVQGLLSNWNLLKSYVYDGDRDQSTGNARIDGFLAEYNEFWTNNGTDWVKTIQPALINRWITAATATIFDPQGYNLESKDALGIYSSILLGYNNTLKIGEAVNSRYYEIGYDGFEDRNYDHNDNCVFYHFRFGQDQDLNFGSNNAHTGKYSLFVGANSVQSRSSNITNSIDDLVPDHTVPYMVQSQELIGTHTFVVSPTEDNRYVLTAWVKEEVLGQSAVLSYDNAQINVSGVTLSNIEEKRSNIIDGWQRIEINFTIPAIIPGSGASVIIELANTGSNNMYFDDVRIQPFNSEMVSYVINPIDLRLSASLDNRNFATFYQYDEEGSLVRIIQETERGRVTVQENRAGIRISQ